LPSRPRPACTTRDQPKSAPQAERPSEGRRSYPSFRVFLRAVSATLSHPITTVVSVSRPRVYDEPRVATAIRLPTSLHEELQSVASERDVSVNFLVTRAVSTFLAQLPPAGREMERDMPSKGSQKGKKHRHDR
jgi:hypothetical protein